jgi:hypothetical protein
MLKSMLRKTSNILVSLLLLLPFFTGAGEFFYLSNNDTASFQEPCHMDQCNPYTPKCPLCPSVSSISLIFDQEGLIYLPTFNPSYIQIISETLTDQGFTKSIFHPPTV